MSPKPKVAASAARIPTAPELRRRRVDQVLATGLDTAQVTMYSFPTETTKPPSMRPNHNFGVPPELVQDREVCAILAHSDACLIRSWLRAAVRVRYLRRWTRDGQGVAPKKCVCDSCALYNASNAMTHSEGDERKPHYIICPGYNSLVCPAWWPPMTCREPARRAQPGAQGAGCMDGRAL